MTHNEALLRLDALAQLCVRERSRTSPPTDPAPGERHIVAAGATGAWVGHEGEVALHDAGWRFLVPGVGWRAYVEAEGRTLTHDGIGWRDLLAATPGGGVRLCAEEEELDLAGAVVEATLAIPNRAIGLAVASRTLAAVAPGATNVGVIGPQAFYADTPLRVTALGGAFTGGRVRLVLSYLAFDI